MPLTQYGEYAPFSYAHGMISKQLLDQVRDRTIKKPVPEYVRVCVCASHLSLLQLAVVYEHCKTALQLGTANASDICSSIPDAIQQAAGNFNVYDVTKTCEGSLCYDMDPMTRYLNLPSVMRALGVRTSSWTACNDTVSVRHV